MSVVGITTRGNQEQANLINLILDKNIKVVFVEGNAGTGKSFISIASALQTFIDGRFERIIYTRDLVQVGEPIGFLPGGLDSKVDPYMACLDDSLEAIERVGGQITVEVAHQYIEVQPITFIRGRSLYNSIILVDEAQNLDLNTLRTVLTRLGENSKIILMGSTNQIDKRGQKTSGCDFARVRDKLIDRQYVGYVRLIRSERSKICAEIDDLLQEI